MKLDDILALRPVEGASVESLQADLASALGGRAELQRRIHDAQLLRSDGLLTADDKTLMTAEKDAATARLAVERLDAVLPALRAALQAAKGLETVQALRRQATELAPLLAAVRQWQAEDYPRIAAMIGRGLHAQHAIMNAVAAFRADVEAAYVDPAVRSIGEMGVALPTLNGPEPILLFPNWQVAQPNV